MVRTSFSSQISAHHFLRALSVSVCVGEVIAAVVSFAAMVFEWDCCKSVASAAKYRCSCSSEIIAVCRATCKLCKRKRCLFYLERLTHVHC